jgi:predicted alpha/beta-hydrolase family hydrolase
MTVAVPEQRFRFFATDSSGDVSAVLQRPDDAFALIVVAHGAGAGLDHWFMKAIADRLAVRGLAVLRYNFPFTEHGKKRPDHQPKLLKTVRSAHARALEVADGLPVFEGGKSMGGRMTTLVAAAGDLEGTSGLVFFGFPLHSPAKPGVERAAHLPDVAMPMLFLQGSRDALARLELLEPVLEPLPDATLHVIDQANHGFHVPKRTGRTDDDVLDELADIAVDWTRSMVASAPRAD